MAVFEGNIYSEALGMLTGLTVILPEQRPKDEPMAVLYLLHGLSDNHASWLYRTRIECYVRTKNIAVVMPEVQRSMYTDMVYGLKYFTYISEELPAICRSMFHITEEPARTYIAGLSMGGYGAMKCALRHPERYGAVGAFSSLLDVKGLLSGDHDFENKEVIAIHGDRLLPENDLFMLTADAAKRHIPLPPMYLTCGLSDFLYNGCARFRKQLDFLKISYVYEEWAGDHNWDFWDRSIKQFLQIILKK